MYINDSNYVDKAEEVIRTLKSKGRENKRTGERELALTTSKIRNLLAMTDDIYNEVMNQGGEALSGDVCGRISYLRVRFIYEAGRDGNVKDFVEQSKILDILKEIGSSRENYILFNHYMEALVAFHRYYGGRDLGGK